MNTYPLAKERQVMIVGNAEPKRRRYPVQRVDGLLREGKQAGEVAVLLHLHVNYVQERQKLMRAELAGGTQDSSTPKFARDDLFVAIVLAHGGLPTAHRLDNGVTVYLGPNGGPFRPRTPPPSEIEALYRRFPND